MNSIVPVFLANGFDWGSLLPILIFALYGLSQIFGRKKEDEQDTEAEIEAEWREQAEAEAEQERIRRKIEERMQMPSSTDPAPQPVVRPPVLREVAATEDDARLAPSPPHAPMSKNRCNGAWQCNVNAWLKPDAQIQRLPARLMPSQAAQWPINPEEEKLYHQAHSPKCAMRPCRC
ncbi:MAG: hypothetical protein LR015_11300 [Verrucomicrobia bacterium]|nr:hypothetical protein [Verrucomicrobiota bacterium]